MSPEMCVASERLIELAQENFTQSDIDLIKRACAFADEHYASIKHPTGKPCHEYAFSVAKLLVDFGSTPTVICAAIICPPPILENKFSDLRNVFTDQKELLNLVEEMLRLDKLEWGVWTAPLQEKEVSERRAILEKMFLLAIDETKCADQERGSIAALYFQKKEKQVENLIRMFLAEVTDIRAIVIKLFDRLLLIQILKYLTQYQRESIPSSFLAKTTLAIYAPLADRLGLWQLKSDLEDMSFRLLDMDTYKQIARHLALKKQQREDYISHTIIPTLEKTLRDYGLEVQIHGRAKHIYSIYKKMEAKQLTFNEINDLLGVRIIVDGIDDCYLVQDIIHEYWPPVTEVYEGERGRDWIAHSKENGYQSLHTTILIDDKMLEVQIRTHEMHEIAEYGAAAEHWRYKVDKLYRKGKVPRVTKAKDQIWSQQVAQLRKSLATEQKSTELAQEPLLKNQIFVITPKGHVIDLRAGATPLDFAYRIHTDLGHRYAGAKVDGHVVRLHYKLKNGEMVELIPSRARTGPSPEWLTRSKDEAGNSTYVFARTSNAREKIHKELKKQKHRE